MPVKRGGDFSDPDAGAPEPRAVPGPREPAAFWPRRCAGDAIRVGAIAAGDGGSYHAERVIRDWSGFAERERCVLWLVLPQPKAPPAVMSAARGVCAGVIAAGVSPAPLLARLLAELDLDVLVDLSGDESAFASLLALRPARLQLALAAAETDDPVRLVGAAGSGEVQDAALPGRDEARGASDSPVAWPAQAVDAAVKSAAWRESPRCPVDEREMRALWRSTLEAHRAGRRGEAESAYVRLLELQPEWPVGLLFAGRLALDDGRIEVAVRRLRSAAERAPDWAAARVALAEALAAAGDLAAARVHAVHAAALAPGDATVQRRLGLVALAQGDARGAIEALAIAARHAPADVDSRYNLGVALQSAGRFEEAAAAYGDALRLDPTLGPARLNRAAAALELGRVDDAVAEYRELVRLDPRAITAHKNLCEVLLAQGRFDDWQAAYDAFEKSCPRSLARAVVGLEALQYRGDFAGIERLLRDIEDGGVAAASAEEQIDSLEQLLYLMLFFDVPGSVELGFYRRYDEAMRGEQSRRPPRVASPGDGRIRVGYVSADFCDHVMGKMAWEAIGFHDRSRFDVRCYHTGSRRDEWTERFESTADRFVSLAGMSDDLAASRIAEDAIDVLIDLSTHTRGARPGIFARKPARVAITHVASAGALGLASVDFKLTDRFADTGENQAHMIERLLPVDGCVYPFRPFVQSVSDGPSRQALDIDAGAFVIGAFFTPMKLSRRCLALWRRVLDAIPDAVILFSPSHLDAGRFHVELARRAGIDPGRCRVLRQPGNEADDLARYRIVDVVLDPFPFGGVNGTLEALAMGVPVVTLRGRRHQERTGYSMLAHLGLTELVASDEAEYEAIASRVASDRQYGRSLRARIGDALAACGAGGRERYARSLERAYLEALASCAGK